VVFLPGFVVLFFWRLRMGHDDGSPPSWAKAASPPETWRLPPARSALVVIESRRLLLGLKTILALPPMAFAATSVSIDVPPGHQVGEEGEVIIGDATTDQYARVSTDPDLHRLILRLSYRPIRDSTNHAASAFLWSRLLRTALPVRTHGRVRAMSAAAPATDRRLPPRWNT